MEGAGKRTSRTHLQAAPMPVTPKKKAVPNKRTRKIVEIAAEESDRETFDLDAISGSDEGRMSVKQKATGIGKRADVRSRGRSLNLGLSTSTVAATYHTYAPQRLSNKRSLVDLYASSAEESPDGPRLEVIKSRSLQRGERHCFVKTKLLSCFHRFYRRKACAEGVNKCLLVLVVIAG